jgi:catechol 2,3-dioxygenase-like lactoylglutathione lyase family enzyme
VPISEIIIRVGDLDEAVEFYTRVVGFRLVRTVEREGARVAELDADGQRVTLAPASSAGVHLVLGTEDVSSQRRRLKRRNLDLPPPLQIPEGAWLGFTDPWGNELAFWEDREPRQQPE